MEVQPPTHDEEPEDLPTAPDDVQVPAPDKQPSENDDDTEG
jgi:hypothetical protein